MIDLNHSLNTKYWPVVLGFVISIIITLVMLPFATSGTYGHTGMLAFVLILGAVQALVQLITFMHLGFERGPQYGLMVFCFMIVIAFIVVAGSLWIMSNVQYNELLPREFGAMH